MKLNAKLIVTALTLITLPFAVNVALSMQILQQQAAMISPTPKLSLPNMTTPETARPDSDIRLSCSICLQAGKSDLCTNIKEGVSYCKHPQETAESKDDNVPLNLLCIRCATPSITGSPTTTPIPSITCTPPPPCLTTTPRCELPEPAGGWCKVSVTPSQPHLVLSQSTFTPTTCGFSLDIGAYVCKTFISAAPNTGGQTITWRAVTGGLAGMQVVPGAGQAGNNLQPIQFTVPKASCNSMFGKVMVGSITFTDNARPSDQVHATFACTSTSPSPRP